MDKGIQKQNGIFLNNSDLFKQVQVLDRIRSPLGL